MNNGYEVKDVMRYVDRVAQADLDEPILLYVKYVRAQLARAVATLDVHPMPAEVRQAVEIVITNVYELSKIGGEDDERTAHTRNATEKRVKDQQPAIEARREQIRAFCQNKKRKWPYDMPELPGRLAVELGNLDGKKRTRAALRKLYERDLDALARTQQRGVSD